MCMEGRGVWRGGGWGENIQPCMGWDEWVELKGKGLGGMRSKETNHRCK